MENKNYCVILIRNEIDRFKHNTLFSEQIKKSLARLGWESKVIDYMASSRAVWESFHDSNCKFFITFNGFGTELEVPSSSPGMLHSAFSYFEKPVLDIMHDCPLHETMLHQLNSTFPLRYLFITDYTYAQMATDLGVKNVNFVPSITFPDMRNKTGKNALTKKNEILFAVGLSKPSYGDRIMTNTRKGKLYKSIFNSVIEDCGENWSLDPITELNGALRDLNISFDNQNVDHRFLLTCILDYVKFDRRQRMLASISGLPVTVVSDHKLDPHFDGKGFSELEARNAHELMNLMDDYAIVLCPTTHFTGFHERPLFAFNNASTVVSAPCRPLESHFTHNEDIVFYSDNHELRASLETLLNDQSKRERIGNAGQKNAKALFHPDRLVKTMLNSLRRYPF